MKKQPIEKLNVKLMAFDLDDTLLNDEKDISLRTVETLKKAAKKGIYVVLCSGRAENGILPFVRKLDIAGTQAGRYLIGFNGASIFDLHTRLPIFSRALSVEIQKYVYEECKKRNLPAITYSPDTIYTFMDTEWARIDAELCNLKFEIVDDFDKFLDTPRPKMLVPADPKEVAEFQKFLATELEGKADVFISKPFFLEVMTKGVGKGEAILHLAETLGIPKNETLAFGDSMNDESMLTKCGFGVAMKNGLDYIKEISTFVTKSDNNHDGVAEFIEEFVL